MNLSERAYKYLKALERHKEWVSEESEIKAYLSNQDVSKYDEFLKFQLNYSGYELTIKNDLKNSFRASLFSNEQIKNNEKLDIDIVGDSVLAICGCHKTAQFTFFITDKGEFCTLDDEDLPNILNSSFDKVVEEYALRNELYKWDSNPYYYEVLNVIKLEEQLSENYEIIPECSDEYSVLWRSENTVAVRGVWLDRHEYYFHVYGQKRNDCDKLINDFKSITVLR